MALHKSNGHRLRYEGACRTDAEYGSSWGTLGTEGAELTVVRSPATAAPLDGRTVVITGASDGIGAAAARRVAGLGARVVVVGRSAQKTAAVADSIGATALTGDFARLEDVRRVAGQILALCPRIDVLANNAGAMFPGRMVTADGNEMTFQVNYLAGFLLTGLLLPRLTATPGSRVLATSSMINRAGRIDLDDLNRSGSSAVIGSWPPRLATRSSPASSGSAAPS